MNNNRLFFSLRWKLAILFGSVFLVLHSIFSYVAYLDAIGNFNIDRKTIQTSHIDIAKALTEDSFLVLEQFSELVPLIGELPPNQQQSRHHAFTELDDNWSQWLLSWGIETIIFFNKQGRMSKTWGRPKITVDAIVKKVLQDETPAHHIFCHDSCFQQVIIPVIRKSEMIGAFSMIRSFADVIIKYKQATGSDIGVLAVDDNHRTEPGNGRWAYKVSGMTQPEKNLPVYDFISRHYSIAELLVQSKTVELEGATYEVRIFPVQKDAAEAQPFFLFIDDISTDVNNLNEDLKQVWLYGVVSLMVSVSLLVLLLHVSLGSAAKLARALPLLSRNQYDQFRKQVVSKNTLALGYDELDRLNQTALVLTDQLEYLEKEVRSNTLKLLEKSKELANERDFNRQLLEAAPIIIITQKLNGMILTINQAGAEEFDADNRSIIGKVFDLFLPESDWEHLKKLDQLRAGAMPGRFHIDGRLQTETGKYREISWLHTLFKLHGNADAAVILTLGVNISERKMYEQKILSMVARDDLTGLSNRKKFQEELSAALDSAQRYGYKVALFYLDLDEFKQINNIGGHEQGDKLLALVANMLMDSIRTTDLISRIGGDEFALIVHHAEFRGVKCIAEKVSQALNTLALTFAGENHKLSASIGIAVYPEHGLTVNELLANADLARYQAKASGSGHYHIFAPDSDYQLKMDRMLYWRQTLEHAIARDRIILLYQPVLNIKAGTINHFECRIRLQQDDGQLIMPGDFIGQAEELGLTGKIDRIVLKKAIQKLIEFKHQGKAYKLAVNLSGRLANDATFFAEISQLFSASEIDPSMIIFEITEIAAVSDLDAIESLMLQIKSLGCMLALDDFGVGFSSFYYLKHFPVDYVKIDGAIIRQINKSDDDKVFVKALSGVARAFGKKTVAEFVENEETLNILREFEIDFAQGYYIGKPAALS